MGQLLSENSGYRLSNRSKEKEDTMILIELIIVLLLLIAIILGIKSLFSKDKKTTNSNNANPLCKVIFIWITFSFITGIVIVLSIIGYGFLRY